MTRIGIKFNQQENIWSAFGQFTTIVENQFKEFTSTYKRFSKNNLMIKT